MTHSVESPPTQAGDGLSNVVQLGGIEQRNNNKTQPRRQSLPSPPLTRQEALRRAAEYGNATRTNAAEALVMGGRHGLALLAVAGNLAAKSRAFARASGGLA